MKLFSGMGLVPFPHLYEFQTRCKRNLLEDSPESNMVYKTLALSYDPENSVLKWSYVYAAKVDPERVQKGGSKEKAVLCFKML